MLRDSLLRLHHSRVRRKQIMVPSSGRATVAPTVLAIVAVCKRFLAQLVILFSVFAGMSLGQGDEDCFRGQDGASYETCCREERQARLCWGPDAEWISKHCCESASLMHAEERLDLLANVIFDLQMTVKCELRAWQARRPSYCEMDLLAELAALDVVDVKFLNQVWSPSMTFRNGRTPLEGLHFAMLLCQTALQWRTAKMMAESFGADFLTPFRLFHAAAASELHQVSLEATGKSWARQLALLKKAPLEAHAVHVALVASVGEPVFAAKAMATIRSALFFAMRRKVHFHLFVDTAGAPAMRQCLYKLQRDEPTLAARAAAFELHGEDVLRKYFQLLQRSIVPGCLGQTQLFGDAGWIRLFVHELFRDRPDLTLLVFVDAGDYVFLEDVSLVLRQRGQFKKNQVGASPRDGDMPFQLLDLPRMRRANFTKILVDLVRSGFQEFPSYYCSLGEGVTTRQLTKNASLWHIFDEPWVVEPREHGGLQARGGGMKDVWHPLHSGSVWQDRVYPNLFDWTVLQVHCPLFSESLLATSFEGRMPPGRLQYKFYGWIVRSYHLASVMNASLEASGLHNGHLGYLRCNSKARGLHFTSTLRLGTRKRIIVRSL